MDGQGYHAHPNNNMNMMVVPDSEYYPELTTTDMVELDDGENRIDVLKLILYDLNSAIAPRDIRLMAIQAALDEFDHHDETLHDEELELRADHILLQKLAYAMMIDPSSDEVGYICSAMEMVYRAGKTRLAKSFHDISEALLPVFVEMIRPPPLLEQGKQDDKSEQMMGERVSGVEERKEDVLLNFAGNAMASSHASATGSAPFMEEISNPDVDSQEVDEEASAESVTVNIPSQSGEYVEEMHKVSSASSRASSNDQSSYDGRSQSRGHGMHDAYRDAPAMEPVNEEEVETYSASGAAGSAVLSVMANNVDPNQQQLQPQQLQPNQQPPVAPQQQYSNQVGRLGQPMPEGQGQYPQQQPMPQQPGQYQQPPPMPQDQPQYQQQERQNPQQPQMPVPQGQPPYHHHPQMPKQPGQYQQQPQMPMPPGQAQFQPQPHMPQPQGQYPTHGQPPVAPGTNTAYAMPTTMATPSETIAKDLEEANRILGRRSSLDGNRQSATGPVRRASTELVETQRPAGNAAIRRKLSELTMGEEFAEEEDAMRLRGGGRNSGSEDGSQEGQSHGQHTDMSGEEADQFNEELPDRQFTSTGGGRGINSMFRSNINFDPSVYEGSTMSDSMYSSDNPFSDVGDSYRDGDSEAFAHEEGGARVRGNFQVPTSGAPPQDNVSNFSDSSADESGAPAMSESNRTLRRSNMTQDFDDGVSNLSDSRRSGSANGSAHQLDTSESEYVVPPRAANYDDGVSDLHDSFQKDSVEFLAAHGSDDEDSQSQGAGQGNNENQNPFHPEDVPHEDRLRNDDSLSNMSDSVQKNTQGYFDTVKKGFTSASRDTNDDDEANDNPFRRRSGGGEGGHFDAQGGYVGLSRQSSPVQDEDSIPNPFHGECGGNEENSNGENPFRQSVNGGDASDTPPHGIGGFGDKDEEDNVVFDGNTEDGFNDAQNVRHHGIGGFDDEVEVNNVQGAVDGNASAEQNYYGMNTNNSAHQGIGGFNVEEENMQGKFPGPGQRYYESQEGGSFEGGFQDRANTERREYSDNVDGSGVYHPGYGDQPVNSADMNMNMNGNHYYDAEAPIGYDQHGNPLYASQQEQENLRNDGTSNYDQMYSENHAEGYGGVGEEDEGFGLQSVTGEQNGHTPFQPNSNDDHQHSASIEDISHLEKTMYGSAGAQNIDDMNMPGSDYNMGSIHAMEHKSLGKSIATEVSYRHVVQNEDIFQFKEPEQKTMEQGELYNEEYEEGLICPLAVRKVLKILRYFSRVLSAMEPLAQQVGLIESLLYQMAKRPHSMNSEEDIAARVDAIAIIVNLACAEENKIMLVYHPGLLDAVVNIANFDPIDEAREHAAIVIMNLAYAEENKVHMVNQDQLLDTLIHLLSDVSPFTRRYASAALFTLACTYANTAVMSRHCDGGILEALRKVLLNDPIDEARVNAAEALFNMARNNSDDTVENMGNHPKLLASLAHSVLTDYSAEVRAYSARALEWLAADIHHPMACHPSLLKALTTASQWTKTTCIAEALKMQASLSENRRPMVVHHGLLDALAALALLDGVNDDELKICAITALERLSKEVSTRHIMAHNEGVITALTKATFAGAGYDEDEDGATPTSLLMKTALKNLAEHL